MQQHISLPYELFIKPASVTLPESPLRQSVSDSGQLDTNENLES